MENREQVYSTDGSNYMIWENLMNDLKESYDIGESVEIWEAYKIDWKHADFIDVDDLIYQTQWTAVSEAGETAEEYLDELTKDQKTDLENHIADWFNKNAKIDFYGVENEKKIVVIVE